MQCIDYVTHKHKCSRCPKSRPSCFRGGEINFPGHPSRPYCSLGVSGLPLLFQGHLDITSPNFESSLQNHLSSRSGRAGKSKRHLLQDDPEQNKQITETHHRDHWSNRASSHTEGERLQGLSPSLWVLANFKDLIVYLCFFFF